MNLFERIVDEIRAERGRQDEKWGVQNHEMLQPGSFRDAEFYRFMADMWKKENDRRVAEGNAKGMPSDANCAWDGIFTEEFAEAFAEERPGLQYAEMVQTAAVAFAILDHLNRKAQEQTEHYAGCPALDVDWIVTAPEACTCETPRFEAMDLNPDGPYAGWAWGVWDNRDKKWWPGDIANSQSECESAAARLNAEEANR